MNKGYGGAQPKMRESIIKEEDGYLGMNQRTLTVGDTQTFIFQQSYLHRNVMTTLTPPPVKLFVGVHDRVSRLSMINHCLHLLQITQNGFRSI